MPTLLASVNLDQSLPIAPQLEVAKKVVQHKLSDTRFRETEVQIIEGLRSLFLYHSNPFAVDAIIQIVTKENGCIRQVIKDEPRLTGRPVEQEPPEAPPGLR